MDLFEKSKNCPHSNHHLEKADKLIKSANIYAIGTYVPLLNKFPELEAVEKSELLELWDYLVTIASVGTAFAEIADTCSKKEQSKIAYAIQKRLNDWQAGSYDVMEDFLNYANKLIDSGVEMPDAIGAWVWINLEKNNQANQQLKELASSLKLVRVVGLPILIAFHDWWEKE